MNDTNIHLTFAKEVIQTNGMLQLSAISNKP